MSAIDIPIQNEFVNNKTDNMYIKRSDNLQAKRLTGKEEDENRMLLNNENLVEKIMNRTGDLSKLVPYGDCFKSRPETGPSGSPKILQEPQENTIINNRQQHSSNNSKKSFCIEALLAKNNAPVDATTHFNNTLMQQSQQTLQEKMSQQKYLAIIHHHQQLNSMPHFQPGQQEYPTQEHNFVMQQSQQNNLLQKDPTQQNYRNNNSDVEMDRLDFEQDNFERQIASNTIDRYERESVHSGVRSPSSHRSGSPGDNSDDHRSAGSYSPPISPGMEMDNSEYADQRTGELIVIFFNYWCYSRLLF